MRYRYHFEMMVLDNNRGSQFGMEVAGWDYGTGLCQWYQYGVVILAVMMVVLAFIMVALVLLVIPGWDGGTRLS